MLTPASSNFTNNSLFIGDLSKFCTEVELENLFVPFGQILDVKIKRNNNTGKTLSYGFVTFANEEVANNAMKTLDGSMFCGRKLRIRWAMYNARSQNPINDSVINSVYVRFVTPKLDVYVTEEDLHNVFDSYGSVLDVSIKESCVDKRTNRQSGYGFVHFSTDRMGVECAFQAVSAVDNATVNGVTYYVELSKNLLKQFNELRQQDAISAAGQGAPGNSLPVAPHHSASPVVRGPVSSPSMGHSPHLGSNVRSGNGAQYNNMNNNVGNNMGNGYGGRGGSQQFSPSLQQHQQYPQHFFPPPPAQGSPYGGAHHGFLPQQQYGNMHQQQQSGFPNHHHQPQQQQQQYNRNSPQNSSNQQWNPAHQFPGPNHSPSQLQQQVPQYGGYQQQQQHSPSQFMQPQHLQQQQVVFNNHQQQQYSPSPQVQQQGLQSLGSASSHSISPSNQNHQNNQNNQFSSQQSPLGEQTSPTSLQQHQSRHVRGNSQGGSGDLSALGVQQGHQQAPSQSRHLRGGSLGGSNELSAHSLHVNSALLAAAEVGPLPRQQTASPQLHQQQVTGSGSLSHSAPNSHAVDTYQQHQKSSVENSHLLSSRSYSSNSLTSMRAHTTADSTPMGLDSMGAFSFDRSGDEQPFERRSAAHAVMQHSAGLSRPLSFTLQMPPNKTRPQQHLSVDQLAQQLDLSVADCIVEDPGISDEEDQTDTPRDTFAAHQQFSRPPLPSSPSVFRNQQAPIQQHFGAPGHRRAHSTGTGYVSSAASHDQASTAVSSSLDALLFEGLSLDGRGASAAHGHKAGGHSYGSYLELYGPGGVMHAVQSCASCSEDSADGTPMLSRQLVPVGAKTAGLSKLLTGLDLSQTGSGSTDVSQSPFAVRKPTSMVLSPPITPRDYAVFSDAGEGSAIAPSVAAAAE